jgi:hypothetical protein
MKRFSCCFSLLCLLVCMPGLQFAQTFPNLQGYPTDALFVQQEEAFVVAQNHILHFDPEKLHALNFSREMIQDEQALFYVVQLLPVGYVVVSASRRLPPVPAYSLTYDFGTHTVQNPLYWLLQTDLANRLEYFKLHPDASDYQYAWDSLESSGHGGFEQWPATGNGWLKTNWTQYGPYNNFCPIDPVTQQRSLAGCPAVAMAQIVNYHQTTNNLQFDDTDDYYHSYAGRNFWIDDDHATHGFPSFPQLNEFLDTLNAHYAAGLNLSNQDMATLVFASGVACKQVFTSQVSGTFGVNQAYDAFLRFGFEEALLLTEQDETLYLQLQQNIKDALPAHLALVDPGWTTGHNVVVDGYNTDDYYHLNFGWGGSANGWYLLPQEMPYNLTVIEGLVVDIKPISTAVSERPEAIAERILVYPNPSDGVTTFSFSEIIKSSALHIYNINGKHVKTIEAIKGKEVSISTATWPVGLYLFHLQHDAGMIGHGKFMVE